MWYRLDPLDVLLFREAKPFSAGENFRAAGSFPPTPLPLVGALRNCIFEHLRESGLSTQQIFEKMGGPDDLGPLKMQGPFLASKDNILCLPVPKDLLRKERGNEKAGMEFLLIKKPDWDLQTSLPKLRYTLESPLIETRFELKTLEKGFLKGDCLIDYLLENTPQISFYENKLVEDEPHLGIQLSPSRTSITGKIYTVVFNRLEDQAGILVKLESENNDLDTLMPNNGFLNLGGESRAAHFQRIVSEEKLPEPLSPGLLNSQKEDLISRITEQKSFKLLLLTPAICERGWLPDGIDENNFNWTIKGITLTLVAAVVDKPQPVSGWDLVENAPRTLFRAVPAGSVYYFLAEEDLNETTARNLVEEFHFKSTLITNPFFQAAGFGLTAVGIWTESEA